jgi:pyruvate,water dikinase
MNLNLSQTFDAKQELDDYIVGLDYINLKDSQLYGGKAANLGYLSKEFNVPAGFGLSSKVFQQLIMPLEKQIDTWLKFDTSDFDAICRVSEYIIAAIKCQTLPCEVMRLIEQYQIQLEGPYAVRSSAALEDLKNASFAGQQSTELNVVANLHDAIITCFASYYNASAILYREIYGFGHRPCMAVVIQKMVDSRLSGVTFTRHPVSPDKGMLIEFIEGQGEALVSGAVTPHALELSRQNNELHLDYQTSILSTCELQQLARTCLDIESYYGYPMDIEWAMTDCLHILQARPITTL